MQFRPVSIAMAQTRDRTDGAPGTDHAASESAVPTGAAMANWPGGIGEEPAFDDA